MEKLSKIIKKRDNARFFLKPNFPTKNLLLELTNICNHKCVFCANRKMTRKKGIMSDTIILKALNQAYDLGCREVGFYATGEPLIHKNIYFAIKSAKQLGYKYCYLTTNGALCDLKKTKKLLECGIDSIKFSINALDKTTYNFIHGVDDFDNVINNLKNIYNYRKTNNLKFKIFVSYISTKYSNYNIEVIKNFFKNFCDDVLVVNVRNQSGLMPEVNKLLSDGDDNEKVASQRCLPCHYVFNAITVSCEGYVTACCTDYQNYLAYGDLNKENLSNVWQNDTITNLRQQHLDKKLKNNLCKNCIYNTKKIPYPINPSLCTPINKDIFNIKTTKIRIKKYESICKKQKNNQ